MEAPTIIRNILDYGADATGANPSTEAIQRALDSVDGNTPARIRIPRGTFLAGLLHPRSNTEIHLEAGAVLKADPDYASHEFEGKVGGILLARDLDNVSVTGPGTIDGNENVWFDHQRSRSYIDYDVTSIRQGAGFLEFPNPFPDGPVEPLRRPGNLLIFSNCTRVRLSGFQVRGSAYWTIHLADCTDIVAEHLDIQHDQRIPNNDGIHLSSCRHALLRHLDIRSGDDAIALTGFRDLKGEPEIELGFRNLDGELSDIRVEHCRLSSRSSAIRIGYGANDMSDIRIENVEIHDSNRGILIQARDAGSISDVTIRKVRIQTRLMAGSWWGNGEPVSISSAHRLDASNPLGTVRRISLSQLEIDSPSPIFLYGATAGLVSEIRFQDCHYRRAEDPLKTQKGETLDLRPIHDPKLALLNTTDEAVHSHNAGQIETVACSFPPPSGS